MTQSITALTVGNVAVRQHAGLFCLNDLHRAAGSEKRHQPSSQRQMEIALKVVHAALCKELDSAVPVFYEPIKSAISPQACR